MRKSMSGIALALALAMGVQGCYGSFALTKKLWAWNGSMGHGLDEGVFLLLTIIPVYQVSTFVDAIALNSIEFWTGKSPLATVVTQGNKKIAMKGDPSTGLVQVSAYTDGKLTNVLYLKKTSTGIAAVDPADGGRVLLAARIVSEDNAVLTDAAGKLLPHGTFAQAAPAFATQGAL